MHLNVSSLFKRRFDFILSHIVLNLIRFFFLFEEIKGKVSGFGLLVHHVIFRKPSS